MATTVFELWEKLGEMIANERSGETIVVEMPTDRPREGESVDLYLSGDDEDAVVLAEAEWG